MKPQAARKTRRVPSPLPARPESPRLWHPASIRRNLASSLFTLLLSAIFAVSTNPATMLSLLRGAAPPSRWWLSLAGKGALALILFVISFAYLNRLEVRRTERRRLFLVFGAMAILFVLAAQALVLFGKSPYALPLSAAAILLSLLHSRRAGLVLSALMSLLLGVTLQPVGSQTFLAVVVLFAGAALVTLELPQIRRRLAILEAGVSVSALQVALLLAGWAAGLHGAGAVGEMLWDLLAASLNGVGVAIVLTAALPLIERAFSMTTELSLLELSDQNHPLMRRLVMEAPGTYHHSFVVGTLAEGAAEAIGASSLLARVGAYFHDIGKLTRPGYFFENGMPGLNPHDRLHPTMSALIIAAHPRDGVELAHDYRLPRPIIDIIAQHHGNSVIEYFYRRSQEGAEHSSDEAFFRYGGPRPQAKETGIVLLADAVEAASRTLAGPTPARLKHLVHDIVMKRLLDGQFDECGLTLEELHRAEDSLVRALSSLFHARIRYPSEEEPKQAPQKAGGPTA